MLSSIFLSAVGLLCTISSHVIERHVEIVLKYLPIPPSAAGHKIPAFDYYVEDFGKGAYMITDGDYQLDI